MHTKTPIKFAVIQYGYCVHGTGETRAEAVADCEIERINGKRYTPAEIESELLEEYSYGVDATFFVLESDHEDFDGYLADHGYYNKIGNDWFEA